MVADLSTITVEVPDPVESGNDAEFHCEVCGTPLVYSGRGRKPRYCDEHKRGRSSTAAPKRAGNGNVETAVQSLESAYSLLTGGLLLVGATESASLLANSIEAASDKNRKLLVNDPALVKAINRIGTKGGRAAFIIAQVSLLGPVLMTAYGEFSAKRSAGSEPADSRPPFADFLD